MTMALLYCREGSRSADGGGMSLDEQESALIEDAKRRGYEYVVIREGADSGHGRDRLAEAVDLLDQHDADVLMAVRLDRFGDAGDRADSILRRAASRGWGLVVAGEALGPGPVSSRFQDHLDDLAASRLRSQSTRAGIQRRKLEGAVFGRTVSDSFLATYRRVLSMDADGIGMNETARRLNLEGVPTARGGKWYASTVRAILTSDTAKKLA